MEGAYRAAGEYYSLFEMQGCDDRHRDRMSHMTGFQWTRCDHLGEQMGTASDVRDVS